MDSGDDKQQVCSTLFNIRTWGQKDLAVTDTIAHCTQCGWHGHVLALPLANESWFCPDCGMDESGLFIQGRENTSAGSPENILEPDEKKIKNRP